MKNKVKTRFAPSPTGDMHIGNLRNALFGYLFAKKNNGEFILRIEDTDQNRKQENSLNIIFDVLEWTGIKYDNSENIIHQSSRTEIYKKHAKKLVEQESAYYCFCTPDRLETMRKEQSVQKQAPKYDRHCLNLSEKEISEKLKNNEPHVIRMKIPAGETEFVDLVRGKVKIKNNEIDDQILIKSDGFPTYHLASVVDDHESGITHVIRSEEWLPSTPKHLILYKMFGWQAPAFAHLSLVLAPDKSKLSKRHGATGVMEFKKLGYLPEALLNYIALLGWNPGDDREIFSLAELEKEFSLDKVHSAGAIFDINKLDWMNGEYIKKMDLDKLTELYLHFFTGTEIKPGLKAFKPGLISQDKLQKILSLEQERIKKLSDISQNIDYFFSQPEYAKELLQWRKSDLSDAKNMLEFLYAEFEKIPEKNFTQAGLEQFILDLIKNNNYQNGNVLWPLRVALSGRKNSPGPFEIAEILGKDETLKRIQIGIEKI